MKQFLFLIAVMASALASAQPTGNALASNSQVGYVSVADNNYTDLTDSFTVEMWVNSCDVSAENVLLAKGWCSGSDQAYALAIVSGKLQWQWFPVTGNCSSTNYYTTVETSSVVITPGAWYHIAMSHSSFTGVKLYVNGALSPSAFINGSGPSSIRNSSQPMVINGYHALSSGIGTGMPGKMDELRIWQTVRTASQIQSTMNSALSGTETALAAYYKFNETGIGTGIAVANSATATGTLLTGTTGGSSSDPFFTGVNSLITACTPLGTGNTPANTLHVKVYPNPAAEKIHIESSGSGAFRLTITDLTGRIIYQAEDAGEPIDVRKFQPGMYFLVLECSQRKCTERIVVESR